jgi:hypothetical protein
MKVPTYEAQLQRSRQGQGQFLTAQISASAMAAPGRAYAEAGQQTGQVARELSEFFMKKAEIGAKSEASAAASKMQLELAELEDDALRNPNMSQAEEQYRRQSQIIVEKYKTSMSNTLARRAFGSAAVKAQTKALLSFLKQNNERVVEAAKANLAETVQQDVNVASDPSKSVTARRESFVNALIDIQTSEPDLGAEEVRERIEKLYEDTAQSTLLNQVNRPDADAAAIATAFRNGTSTDPMIQAVRGNLSAIQIDAIATAIEKTAARNAKRDNDARKSKDAASKENDEEIARQILFGDAPQQDKADLFEGIKDSTHIPVGTLRTIENYLAGGAQVDNKEDVLEVARLIRSGEITTDAQLIEKLGDEGLEITFNTVRTELLPLITTKTDRAFSQALDWGEATLGYVKSAGAGGLGKLFADKANKAAKLRAEMLAWRADPKKTIKDPMAKAKEITERLLKEGNQSALSQLPVLAENYRKALASGNATRISNARIGLITAMQTGGLVTPLEGARADFDPLTIIDRPQQ